NFYTCRKKTMSDFFHTFSSSTIWIEKNVTTFADRRIGLTCALDQFSVFRFKSIDAARFHNVGIVKCSNGKFRKFTFNQEKFLLIENIIQTVWDANFSFQTFVTE